MAEEYKLKYCCENKCFLEPRCQVDGLACSRCNSYCYCVCRCILVDEKLKNFTIKILNKAKKLEGSGLIGIKIYKGKGFVATNCKKILEEDKYLFNSCCNNPCETCNSFYLYDETITTIPELDTYKPPLPLVVKTFDSIVYVLDL